MTKRKEKEVRRKQDVLIDKYGIYALQEINLSITDMIVKYGSLSVMNKIRQSGIHLEPDVLAFLYDISAALTKQDRQEKLDRLCFKK